MNKPRFKTINEWKISGDLKHLTTINCSGAYCTCGCHELSLFFVFFGLGFFVTINPTKVEKQPKITIEDDKPKVKKTKKTKK